MKHACKIFKSKEPVRNCWNMLPALGCCFYQAAQKLSLVTSLRRPKNLTLGLIYFFMVFSAFPFSL